LKKYPKTGVVTMAFCICAAQVYYHKLARKIAVTSGLYRHIRHPQYAAFMLCSFGMRLIWPRFLALVMFVTLAFAHSFLARIEERECEHKFGQSYVDYKNRTGMFLPFNLLWLKRMPTLPQAGILRPLAILALYLVILTSAIALGILLKRQALDNLQAIYSPQSASVSATQLDEDTLEHIQQIALDEPQVRARLSAFNAEPLDMVDVVVMSADKTPAVIGELSFHGSNCTAV
jgi:protein-S-isoprenylcysteine O-methyltransferase Ste14